jgi:hypothetical protein
VIGRLFTLVNADDHDLIFTWGMEITDEQGSHAVLYRRALCDDPMIYLHQSANAALARWGRRRPLELVWHSDVLTSVN